MPSNQNGCPAYARMVSALEPRCGTPAIAGRLRERWAQPFVVENRVGANGIIAMREHTEGIEKK